MIERTAEHQIRKVWPRQAWGGRTMTHRRLEDGVAESFGNVVCSLEKKEENVLRENVVCFLGKIHSFQERSVL